MADFTTARAAHEADFADAERREVVVQHEAFEAFARFEEFHALFVVLGAERDGDQSLRLTAGEESRTVGAGQNARLAPDGADFFEAAAIGTAADIEHLIAEDLLFESVEELAGFRLLVVGGFLDGARMQRVDLRVAFQLGVLLRIHGVGQFLAELLFDLRLEFGVDLRSFELLLGLSRRRDQLTQRARDLLAAFGAVFQRAQNFVFRRLLRAGFHHHDALFGGRNNDVQLRGARFGVGRVSNVLAVDEAHADRAHKMMKRDIGDRQSGARADDGEHAGVGFRISRQNHRDDLGFVEVAFREQGTHRAVDHAAGQNFLFGKSAFALDVPAGYLARRIRVLAIVAGEREESLVGLRLGSSAGRDEDNRVTHPYNDRSAGLLCDLTGFKRKLLAVKFDFKSMYVHRCYSRLRSLDFLVCRWTRRLICEGGVDRRDMACTLVQAMSSQPGNPAATSVRGTDMPHRRVFHFHCLSMDPVTNDGSRAWSERSCNAPARCS